MLFWFTVYAIYIYIVINFFILYSYMILICALPKMRKPSGLILNLLSVMAIWLMPGRYCFKFPFSWSSTAWFFELMFLLLMLIWDITEVLFFIIKMSFNILVYSLSRRKETSILQSNFIWLLLRYIRNSWLNKHKDKCCAIYSTILVWFFQPRADEFYIVIDCDFLFNEVWYVGTLWKWWMLIF